MTVSAKAISQCSVREEIQIMEGHKNRKRLEHASTHAKTLKQLLLLKNCKVSKTLSDCI